MKLKELRLSAGKTVKDVAQKLNVTQRAISHYEYGSRRINIEQVLILAKLFDCSAEEVIEAQINSLKNPKGS